MNETALWAKVYGEKLAQQMELIERVLQEVASKHNFSIDEGDLDAFCRKRQSKINQHALQDVDEEYERVRLLNMLYEGCLESLREGAEFYESGKSEEASKRMDKAKGIIQHLIDTLEPQPGTNLAEQLESIYQTALERIRMIQSEMFEAHPMEVYELIHQIYLGYLEVEVRLDLYDYFQSRDMRRGGQPSEISDSMLQ